MDKYINQIIQGDCLKILKTLPDNSVDCAITSPPYYGLRCYLPKDHPDKKSEIGSESSMEAHLKVLMQIIGEVKRVLKPTGSFWLNYGDCYSNTPAGNKVENIKEWENRGDGLIGRLATRNRGKDWQDEQTNKLKAGRIKEKCLMMLPERIALRMIDNQGWILRSKIVWSKQVLDYKDRKTKGSVMPTSVKDRFNTSWEYFYHFVKNKKYYFDLDAVRLPVQTFENRPNGIDREKEYPGAKRNKFAFNYRVRDAVKKSGNPQFKASEKEVKEYRDERAKGSREQGMHTFYSHSRRKAKYSTCQEEDFFGSPRARSQRKMDNYEVSHQERRDIGLYERMGENPDGKNLPNVWLIGTEPSKELHFARFPQALCEIPILTTCPKGGVVLDPFAGSGTALQVAQKLGRKYVGMELNDEYIKIAKDKLRQDILL